ERTEPAEGVLDGHPEDSGHRLVPDLHGEGLGIEPRSLADGTEHLALVAPDEDAHVEAILLFRELREKTLDAREALRCALTLPDKPLLRGSELAVPLPDGDAVPFEAGEKLFLPVLGGGFGEGIDGAVLQ